MLCFLAVAVAVTWADRVIPSVAWIIPLSVAVSIFGALNSSMFTLGRLSYAGSQSGHLPVLISMLNVHSCTPAPAMIFSTTIASIFIIPSDLIMLTNYFGFSAWLMIGLTCASLIVLRYREPHLHRPYKVNGNKLQNIFPFFFFFELWVACKSYRKSASQKWIVSTKIQIIITMFRALFKNFASL